MNKINVWKSILISIACSSNELCFYSCRQQPYSSFAIKYSELFVDRLFTSRTMNTTIWWQIDKCTCTFVFCKTEFNAFTGLSGAYSKTIFGGRFVTKLAIYLIKYKLVFLTCDVLGEIISRYCSKYISHVKFKVSRGPKILNKIQCGPQKNLLKKTSCIIFNSLRPQ